MTDNDQSTKMLPKNQGYDAGDDKDDRERASEEAKN
jgi:hypothetical protein